MADPMVASYIAAGGPRVVYHANASKKYGTCVKLTACATFNWLAPCREIEDRTYATVYENKLEYSFPLPICFCCMTDVITTVYLDRPIASRAERAGCCTPAFTHCSFCPTCCDACGEGVVIYGADCFARHKVAEPGVGSCVPCRGFMLMCGFDNADELAKHINIAREAALARMSTMKANKHGGGDAPKAEAMAR